VVYELREKGEDSLNLKEVKKVIEDIIDTINDLLPDFRESNDIYEIE
jgi:predicted secreted protein